MKRRSSWILLLAALVTIVSALLFWYARRGAPPAVSPPLPSSAAPVSTAAPRKAPAPHRTLRLPEAVADKDAESKTGAFVGRVVSARGGEPIDGAELGFAHAGAISTARSGKDGGFRFEPNEPGVHTLALVTAKGYHPFSPAWGQSPITLIAREGEVIRDITIALVPETLYEGLVQSPKGEPVPGAVVRIVGGRGGDDEGRFTTDDKGAFSFAAQDEALLEASHPDYAPARARVDMRVQASGRLVMRLGNKGEEAGGGASIAGKVVGGKGEPAEGVLVVARLRTEIPQAGSSLHGEGQAITDEGGAFTLEGLDEGSYDVVATSEGIATARAESVPAGTQNLELRLSEGGRIRGKVRAKESGAPIVAFSIVVELERGPLEREMATTVSFFDARGEYEISGLLPGSYAVTAVTQGRAPSAPSRVTISSTPGEGPTVDFDLGSGGRLTGLVLEEKTSKPIAGAKVSVEGTLGGASGSLQPLLAETTTDAGGRFVLEGIPAGPRSVAVVAAGHNGRIVSGIVIPEGGGSVNVTVALSKVAPGEEPHMELMGIGAVLAAREDALVLGKVMEGGGAAEAGLATGDAIVRIDGVPVVELGFDRAIQSIRGPEGSTVELVVRKGGEGEPGVVVVRRKRIRG
ncbi:carboxypeptidase regulatory-like domain-containing protein [Polyangium aurulentum]|uniref:carboxypeptidase regulatory-like domain-containing protein n=1 Tax=Polyangium aurulentum TaxID=2567896 RepID=UPI00146A91DE|nr:carboxypeptidase regulatory-like domain-containing protein [Polyangium aurulentum]UQA63380.1 carboxypeptidase regulatory-like domain-containing protein [Polyangium aurulentum]